MLTIIAVLLSAAAPPAATFMIADQTAAEPTDWRCSTERNRLRNQESRETWDEIKALKRDGGAAVPPEAQAILNQMTEMFEKDDSRYSSDTAEMMREFAGAKAERRTAC